MKKKVLVTGATGFIGSSIINKLQKIKNIEIIASSRSKKKAITQNWYNSVNYIEYDLATKKNDLFDFLNRPDIVIHSAWDKLDNYNDIIHFEKNLNDSYYFLKSLINSGVENINCLGTCFEYGMKNGCLNETMDTNPVTTYGLAKDSLRKFLENLNKTIFFNFKWIRLFYIYGENQSERTLLSQLNKSIKNKEEFFNMSGGEQIRDYLYIDEVAKNIVTISLQNQIKGIINCGSGTPTSIRNLVENQLLIKKSNIKLNLGYYNYPDYEPMAFWADTHKLNTIKTKIQHEF